MADSVLEASLVFVFESVSEFVLPPVLSASPEFVLVLVASPEFVLVFVLSASPEFVLPPVLSESPALALPVSESCVCAVVVVRLSFAASMPFRVLFEFSASAFGAMFFTGSDVPTTSVPASKTLNAFLYPMRANATCAAGCVVFTFAAGCAVFAAGCAADCAVFAAARAAGCVLATFACLACATFALALFAKPMLCVSFCVFRACVRNYISLSVLRLTGYITQLSGDFQTFHAIYMCVSAFFKLNEYRTTNFGGAIHTCRWWRLAPRLSFPQLHT